MDMKSFVVILAVAPLFAQQAPSRLLIGDMNNGRIQKLTLHPGKVKP